jgi:isopenicillin-N synthase
MIKSSKIPLIDINALYGTDTVAKQDVGRQIDAVCRKSGFFQITNHGAEENLKNLTEKTFRFFKDLNFEQKIAMARKKHNPKSAHKYRGFFPATVNGKEGFDIGNPNILVADDLAKLPLNEPTQWPNEIELPGFREYFTNFYKLMTDLARTLLKGFALALGKEENFFDDKVRYEDCMTTLRLNHYPFLSSIDAVEVASDGTRLGTETHKDSSLITILYQPIEGLQVEDNEEGWIDISPSETNLVIK